MGRYPTPAGNVGDGESVTNQISMRRLGEVRVHCAVEAAGLSIVAVDGVLDLFRCISWNPVSNRKPAM